jgi:hypothetical protein
MATHVDIVLSSAPLNPAFDDRYTPAGGDWGGLTLSAELAPKTRFAGTIRGDLTGSVSVAQLFRFDVDGTIQGDVSATSSSAPAFFAIECGSISSTSRIQRQSGNIRRIMCIGDCAGEIDTITGNIDLISIGGDCTGTIEAGGGAAGDIGSLIVGGRLGTPSVQASVGFRNDLGSLVAGEINAKIAGPDGRFWGGTIQTLQTTGANGTSGRLAGNITVVSLVPDGFSAGMIKSAGPFEGRIEVLQGLPPIDPPTSGGFRIETPSGGLQGLIVFNVANTVPPAEWEGDVKVGTTTLAPGYSASSASLGGGAVGVLPFGLHGTDCEPAPDGGSVAFALAPGPMTPVQLRHYGTIRIEGTSPENAISLEAKAPEGTNWVDQSDCIDTVGVGANATILEITPNVALDGAV